MTRPEAELITEALTRATVRRDLAGIAGSDEELLTRLDVGSDPAKVDLMVSVGRVLRLMDALLVGSETGEGFVEKFTTLWASLKRAHGRDLREQTARLDAFYGGIQLFCASDRDRSEEPSLFGIDRLKALTEPVYADLRQWWQQQLKPR